MTLEPAAAAWPRVILTLFRQPLLQGRGATDRSVRRTRTGVLRGIDRRRSPQAKEERPIIRPQLYETALIQRIPMTRRAFSLIELLVVLTVLAILAALLFPVFARARGLSRRTVCSSNLRQVNTAMQLYLADHDDGLPVPYDPFRRVSWAAQLNPYLKQFRVFRCPNQVDATFAGRSIWEPPYNVPGNVSIWQSFGFNADHLAPAQPDCRDFDQNGRMTGPPASVFLAADPARTVLCVGVSLAPGPGSWVGRNTRFPAGGGYFPVSYTHLTLPTKRIV